MGKPAEHASVTEFLGERLEVEKVRSLKAQTSDNNVNREHIVLSLMT